MGVFFFMPWMFRRKKRAKEQGGKGPCGIKSINKFYAKCSFSPRCRISPFEVLQPICTYLPKIAYQVQNPRGCFGTIGKQVSPRRSKPRSIVWLKKLG